MKSILVTGWKVPGIIARTAVVGALLVWAGGHLCAESLVEHFDLDVPDGSPVGLIPGWHAQGLHAGAVTDYTLSTPSLNYPGVSHQLTGAGTAGVGYLVLGAGNCVSNVLAWMGATLNTAELTNGTIRFYSSNESAESKTRVAVRIGPAWFASATEFQSSGRHWTLHTFAFTSTPMSWRMLKTNTLTLAGSPVGALPAGTITAIGVFGEISQGPGKIRIDEFQVRPAAHSSMDRDYLVGHWIWAEQTASQQTCRFWKLIEVPRGVFVNRARVRITADNSYRAFIDGMEFGRAANWKLIAEYDLTSVMTPGSHVLAIEAFNDEGGAGMVAGVSLELDDGRVIEVPSDDSWRLVPGHDEDGWLTRRHPPGGWSYAVAMLAFRDRKDLIVGEVQVYKRAPFHPPVLALWQQRWFQATLLSICVLAVGLCLRLLAKLAVHSRAQQVLQRERARIARDIHDDFGAVLTQLVLLGETAQREPVTEPDARAKFARISETGRRLLRSIDEVVWVVNSQRDSLRDFENYVCRYTENFLRASFVRCRMDVAVDIPETVFGLAARRSFFLAIKEALNNVVRHSGATEVLLKMQVEHEQVRVTIEDNGKGFEPAGLDGSRNGLSNIAQRMKEVGGDCRVVSQPGAGCQVELVAPICHLGGRSLLWGWRRGAPVRRAHVDSPPRTL